MSNPSLAALTAENQRLVGELSKARAEIEALRKRLGLAPGAAALCTANTRHGRCNTRAVAWMITPLDPVGRRLSFPRRAYCAAHAANYNGRGRIEYFAAALASVPGTTDAEHGNG